MTDFTAKADETTAQIFDTVTKVQDATIEAVVTFADAVKNAPKPEFDLSAFNVPGVELPKIDLPKADLPSAEEVTAAYFAFAEKAVANSKAFTERFIAAAKPAVAV